MTKNLFTVLIFLSSSVSSMAWAKTYKCSSPSINPDVVRYEAHLSFQPMSVRFDTLLKEDDGSWSVSSEDMADSKAILKPLRQDWAVCDITEASSELEISYAWSKGGVSRGHLRLDLTSMTGEFFSSAELGGTVVRRFTFSDCIELL